MKRVFLFTAAAVLLLTAVDVGRGQDSLGVRKISWIEWWSYARSVAATEEKLVFGGRYGGVSLFDARQMGRLDELGYWTCWEYPHSIQIAGDYAYTASQGLQVIDLTDIPHGQVIGQVQLNQTIPYDVEVVGDYAYLLTNSAGLYLFDVNDPARPQEVQAGRVQEASGLSMARQGEYLFIAQYDLGLRVLSVENPRQPRIVATFYTQAHPWSIAVEGDYAYLGCHVVDNENRPISAVLEIINISEPAHPAEAGSVGGLEQPFRAIEVEDGYLFAGLGNYLRIFDLSDPENPTETGWYNNHYWVTGIAVIGGLAYIASDELAVYDCSNAMGDPEISIPDGGRAHDFGDVAVGREVVWPLTISNIGHRLLSIEALEISDPTSYFLHSETSRWRIDGLFDAADEVRDPAINGVEFVNDEFYVTGSAGGELDNWVYVFDREGNETRRFPQFARTPWGMRDLAWDGELLWGADGRIIYGFNTEGELIRRFNGPLETCRSLAYDPEEQLLWVSDLTSDIIGVTFEGEVIRRIDRPDVRMYGLAWDDEAENGANLLIFGSSPQRPLELYALNPETGELSTLNLNLPTTVYQGRAGGGLAITSEWAPPARHIIGTVDGGGDSVELWQLTNYYGGEQLDIEAESELELSVAFKPQRIGELPCDLNIRSSDVDNPELLVRMSGRGTENRAPRFEDIPDMIEVGYGERIAFDIAGADPDGDHLATTLIYNDLPRTATFTPNDRGGHFSWRTAERDAGEYHPTFKLSDGLASEMRQLTIRVESPDAVGWREDIPFEFALLEPYPNPFNSTLTLPFRLPEAMAVRIEICDISGKRVALIADGRFNRGEHRAVWNAEASPAGLYVCRIAAGDYAGSVKAMLVR